MDGWIVVPNWDRFQHYKDRDPVWIKQYNELVFRDDYLELPPVSRAMLHGIWSMYALSNGLLRADKVGSALRLRVEMSHWEALIDAGFIRVSASRPLALARSREKRREEKKEPGRSHAQKPTPKPANEGRSNVIPADAAGAVEAMIRNRVITDPVDLAAEIAGYHLDQTTADRLRGMLR